MGNDDSDGTPSQITHGALVVLAFLRETDASSREVWLQTSLSESAAYRWLNELAESGVLETETRRKEEGRDVVEYRLASETLGDAAQVVVDRLGREQDTLGW